VAVSEDFNMAEEASNTTTTEAPVKDARDLLIEKLEARVSELEKGYQSQIAELKEANASLFAAASAAQSTAPKAEPTVQPEAKDAAMDALADKLGIEME
jgi:hypothetical protein